MAQGRMRLAIFTSQFPGRVNTFFARDVSALLDAGIHVDVFPLYPLDERFWQAVPECLDEKALPHGRVHHISLAAAARWGSWREVQSMARTLARSCSSAARYGLNPVAKTAYAVAKAWAWAGDGAPVYDHVLAYWGNYSATAAYVFHRLVCRDVPFSVFLHAGTDLYRQQVFLREKLTYADNIFVVCEFNRRFLSRLYPDLFSELDRKITLHHLPIDLEEFSFERGARDAHHVIAVGGLEPTKGYETLVAAAGQLAAGMNDLRVTFVGDGSERAALEAMSARLGILDRVTFQGWRTPREARRALATATVLVHPSAGLGDAVPTVIKEALALGTPVIASDLAGIPELLDGGACGVLVPPSSPGALARAIAALLDNPGQLESYALKGRAHAESIFDIRQNGPRLATILKATTRHGRPPVGATRHVHPSAAAF